MSTEESTSQLDDLVICDFARVKVARFPHGGIRHSGSRNILVVDGWGYATDGCICARQRVNHPDTEVSDENERGIIQNAPLLPWGRFDVLKDWRDIPLEFSRLAIDYEVCQHGCCGPGQDRDGQPFVLECDVCCDTCHLCDATGFQFRGVVDLSNRAVSLQYVLRVRAALQPGQYAHEETFVPGVAIALRSTDPEVQCFLMPVDRAAAS